MSKLALSGHSGMLNIHSGSVRPC